MQKRGSFRDTMKSIANRRAPVVTCGEGNPPTALRKRVREEAMRDCRDQFAKAYVAKEQLDRIDVYATSSAAPSPNQTRRGIQRKKVPYAKVTSKAPSRPSQEYYPAHSSIFAPGCCTAAPEGPAATERTEIHARRFVEHNRPNMASQAANGVSCSTRGHTLLVLALPYAEGIMTT